MKIDKHNINQYINGTILNCSSNGITCIESIPDHIIVIYCYDNKLTHLPKLPSGLKYMDCAVNKLTQLPKLPYGLTYLDCVNNQLNSLPMLPSDLERLYCYNNKLTSYTEGDPHSGYPSNPRDKQWWMNHNKWLNRIEIINKINETK